VNVFTWTPNADGITLTRSSNAKPQVFGYGKEFLVDEEYAALTVKWIRIDAHTLKGTFSRNDRTLLYTNITTVSPDGQHSTRVEEYAGGRKQTYKYDRIGPVPAGDTFMGTWRLVLPRYFRIIKVDGDSLEWSSDVQSTEAKTPSQTAPTFIRGQRGKLDGKEYQDTSRGGTIAATTRMTRIDANTIEVITKVPPIQIPKGLTTRLSPAAELRSKGYEQKVVAQLKGNTLIYTTTDKLQDGAQTEPSIIEYERVK
jgi:hypothetical protein